MERTGSVFIVDDRKACDVMVSNLEPGAPFQSDGFEIGMVLEDNYCRETTSGDSSYVKVVNLYSGSIVYIPKDTKVNPIDIEIHIVR